MMEEMPSAVAVTFSLDNSAHESSGISAHVEFTKVVSTESISMVTVSTQDEIGGGNDLLDLEAGPDMDEGQIVAKAVILVESGNGKVPTGEVFVTAVSPVSDGLSKAELVAASTMVIQRGVRSVFELDCVPLWGSVSICGRRPEMEDSVAAEPRFTKIPIKMLVDSNHLAGGIGQNLTHLTTHFFGVYDGHGGAQVPFFFHFILVPRFTMLRY